MSAAITAITAIAVSPDEKYLFASRYTNFYGKQKETDGYSFDMEKVTFLRRQAVQFREHCSECFAKWHCAGDCFHKSIVVNGGSTDFNGTGRCHINRELTKDQIISKIQEAGGLCWHEMPDNFHTPPN